MIKQSTIERKIQKIEDTLTKMEQGKYTGLSIDYITDQIDWLWKFRYINEEILDNLCTHAVNVMKGMGYESDI